MLRSTPTSLRWASLRGVSLEYQRGRLALATTENAGLIYVGRALDDANLHHREDEPQAGDINGKPGKLIAGAGAEGARTARAAQSADQTASLALLNEHKKNHEQADEQKNEIEEAR